MTAAFSDNPIDSNDGTPMRRMRLLILTVTAALVATMAAPAFAQAADDLTGLDLARRATMQALDLAEDFDDAAPVEGPTDDGDKSNNGQSDKAKTDNGNKGKSDAVKPDKADKVTGRDQAAAAIADAIERGNGNGNAFGQGRSAEVIEKLLNDESPAVLEADDSHGAKVSAMVETYNELRKRDNEDG